MSRSFLSTAGLMADLQSDGGEDIPVGAEAIAPDESDTLAGAVSEITQDESALADANGQIEAAAAAEDGLETLAERVEAVNDADGMTPEVAELVEASVESFARIAKLSGMTAKSIGIPSPESFADAGNRKQLGEATIESIGETAKKIWQTIIDAIKRSIDWVVGFFNKIFGGAERLEKRAASLKEKLGDLEGKTKKEGTLKDEGLATSVQVNGKAATPKDLTAAAATVKSIFAAQQAVVTKLSGAGDATVSVGPNDYGLKAAGGVASKISGDNSVTVSITDTFPGEAVAYVVMPKNVQPDSESANKVKAGSSKIAEGKLKELPVLEVKAIREIADGVEALAKQVVAYKGTLSDINAKKKAFIAKLEAASKEDKNDKGAKKAFKANATVFRRLMDEPAASVAVLAVKSGSSMLQYAERSARQYTGEAKKD